MQPRRFLLTEQRVWPGWQSAAQLSLSPNPAIAAASLKLADFPGEVHQLLDITLALFRERLVLFLELLDEKSVGQTVSFMRLWNETGSSLAFTLASHFWESFWFQSLCWLSSVAQAGAIVLHLRRFQQLRAVDGERKRIARDLRDDLGAGLARIQLLGQRASVEPDFFAPASWIAVTELAESPLSLMTTTTIAIAPLSKPGARRSRRFSLRMSGCVEPFRCSSLSHAEAG